MFVKAVSAFGLKDQMTGRTEEQKFAEKSVMTRSYRPAAVGTATAGPT